MRAALSGSPIRAAAVVAAAILASPPIGMSIAFADEADKSAMQAVTVARAERQCFDDTLQVTGTLTPRREIMVRPAKEGYALKEVLVNPGDTVTSGQVLARQQAPDGSKDGAVDVTAPVAGTVFAASALVGAPVTSGGEPLFRIAQDGELELLADMPVDTMSRVAPNQAAIAEIIGVGRISGKVRLVSNQVYQPTQLGQVRIFLGADKRLRVGAFGRGTIKVAQRCAPAVPLSAVLYGPVGAVVQVVREDRVETRPVTIGLIKDGKAEIQAGVATGETVVARAGAFVRDGDPVRSLASNVAEQQ